jgi:predicted CXXCH cytochrome family protein
VNTITPPNIGNSSGAGLANDHPVDFTYSAALATAAGGLQTPTEGASVRIPSVGKTKPLPLFKDQNTDASGRLECATCHNPHDNSLNGGNYFLRMDNTGSALCLNCHGN